MAGFQLFRADCDTELSGKIKGGCICFYTNLESFFINYKSFYFPRESCCILHSGWCLHSTAGQQARGAARTCRPDNGPHLRNECVTENWAYGHFHIKLCIYQYGCEWRLQSHLTSSLNSCAHVFRVSVDLRIVIRPFWLADLSICSHVFIIWKYVDYINYVSYP